MTETLEQKLVKIDALEQEMLKKLTGIIMSGIDMYLSHLLILGSAKRTVALGSGFRLLVRARNFPAAAPFIRMQIDTALRVFASTLVKDSEAYARAVFHSEPIAKMRDRDGKRLRDAYLVEKLGELHPWIPNVYKQASGLIHFTNRHIFAAAHKVDDETRTVHFLVSGQDPPRPDEDYFEMVDCFFEATRITATLTCGWALARCAA